MKNNPLNGDVVERLELSFSFGMIGFILGMLALSVAVLHFFFGPIVQPVPEPSIGEAVVSVANEIKAAVAAARDGHTPIAAAKESASFDWDALLRASTIVGGLIAAVLGAVAWVKREDARVSACAVGFGASAVLFQFAVYAILALAIVILIGFIASQLGVG